MVWESRDARQASLQRSAAREAIATATPLLTGEFTRHEHEVAGALHA